jgi:hypothetical protein
MDSGWRSDGVRRAMWSPQTNAKPTPMRSPEWSVKTMRIGSFARFGRDTGPRKNAAPVAHREIAGK